MFSRATFFVWAGILVLSGMFLMGQDAWTPPAECIDTDGDGYGYLSSQGCTYTALDCDDTNADVNPGMPEALYSDPVCHDGLDNNCNGWVDEADPYCAACIDTDGDGYGSPASLGCLHHQADCDDTDGDVHPGAVEGPYGDPVCGDAKDNDCDGDLDAADAGCSESGEMVPIPAGCFDMGDAFSEGAGDERPVHSVCISAFEMDVHEVTNAEYSACVVAGECTAPSSTVLVLLGLDPIEYYGNPEYDGHPVIYVTWAQALNYCTWVGKRLPTEAEWEYAARGGLSGARYPWGDTTDCSRAVYDRYYPAGVCYDYGALPNMPQEVMGYAANGYGLYDVAGNVGEWVNDLYGSTYYGSSPTDDPQGPATGFTRVYRGGSWFGATSTTRVADRNSGDPTNRDFSVGFRCAD